MADAGQHPSVARAQSQPAGTAVVSERGAASRRDDRDPETLGRQLADLAAKTTPPVPLHVIHDQIEKTRDVAEEDTHA